MARRRFLVQGIVQGVGFRPHVLRVASRLELSGFVLNAGGHVVLEAQGEPSRLEQLELSLAQVGAPALVRSIERSELDELADETDFRIAASAGSSVMPALPADLAPCPECSVEVTAAGGRRAGYPFTACTRCGARFSIVELLPYDRAGTTLRDFPVCTDCAREYQTPADRRFHAQAIACPGCGPELELLDAAGALLARGSSALSLAGERLRRGAILALKGVGGFQLLVDALDQAAVTRVRERKRREQKAFALLFADVAAAEEHVLLNDAERALLTGPEAPIVLAERRAGSRVATTVAPDNPQLGCLLPASPTHLLLARAVARPLVCTSGNFSGEPLCIDTTDALARLGGIADLFLVHDRVIVRPLDDSVARLGPHGPTLLRRARGYAPRVVAELGGAAVVLALGGDLKAAPSLLLRGSLVLGQHVGDLSEARTLVAFQRNTEDLLRFFDATPDAVACDLHPDYASTRHAEILAAKWRVPLIRVQHHHAHVAAVVAEHRLSGPVLGFAWDGTGLGTDQTTWGGEALIVDGAKMERVAHLPRFALPGGDRASREPWRSALGVLFSVDPALARRYGADWLDPASLQTLLRAIERGVGAPLATSMGRLFDAVAALTGGPARIDFEGQAAMQLEFAARAYGPAEPYPLELQLSARSRPGQRAPTQVSLAPLVESLLHDVARSAPRGEVAAKFHAALVAAALRVARHVDLQRVVLCGGCFQNQLLVDSLTRALEAVGHTVYLPGQIPGNDAGISVGQALVAALLQPNSSFISPRFHWSAPYFTSGS